MNRMKREGRDREWYATVRKIQDETGMLYSQASHQAMLNMGYLGPDHERELAAAHEAGVHKTSAQKELAAEREELREATRVLDFDEAVKLLPDKATAQEITDWISSHPAMVRLDRQRDKTKTVMIDANDILRPPHGQAPSKGAAYQLQHWANHPGEFFKQILGEQKKAQDEAGGKGSTHKDAGIQEVQDLLNEVTSVLSTQ